MNYKSCSTICYKPLLRFSKNCLYRVFVPQDLPISLGYFSKCPISTNRKPALQTFEEITQQRRQEAKRSLLIEAPVTELGGVCKYCQTFGSIEHAFHYNLKNGKDIIHMQFKDESSAHKLFESCSYSSKENIFPVFSRLLKYASGSKTISRSNAPELSIPLEFMNNRTLKDLNQALQECNSVSEQIQTIQLMERLDHMGTKLRFLVCAQIEDAFLGLFPYSQALPFGSSVNGFGKYDCDLDMILCFGDPHGKEKQKSMLCFQSQNSHLLGRMKSQRTLELIADHMQAFYPCVSKVQKILQAKVPIVKCHHGLTDLDCDLSVSNMTGVYMSELLHLYGQIDHRLCPLVYTIRRWAKSSNLTSVFPGSSITNFTLSILAIFFMQNLSTPILPPLQRLRDQAGENDKRITEGVDCSFLRDANKTEVSQNDESLESLLKQFFAFYADFNFRDRGISIETGQSLYKPVRKACYVQNPLELELNISQNMSEEQTQNFSVKCKTAFLKLEENKSSSPQWGIMPLFSDLETMYKKGQLPTRETGAYLKVNNLFDPSLNEKSEVQLNSMLNPNPRVNKKLNNIISGGWSKSHKEHVISPRKQAKKRNLVLGDVFTK